MDQENRLVAVTFDTPEGESPPQTPRRQRPAPPSAVIAHQIAVDDAARPKNLRRVYLTSYTRDTTRMVLTGYRIVHVDAYSYRLKFTIKDKPDPKPRTKKARGPPKPRAPRKKKVYL